MNWSDVVVQRDTVKQLTSFRPVCSFSFSKDALIVSYLSLEGHDIVTPHWSPFAVVGSKQALLADEGAAGAGVTARAFDLPWELPRKLMKTAFKAHTISH
jgi:hypothetical protein